MSTLSDQPNDKSRDVKAWANLENHKIIAEYHKHLGTLSTGSVVLIAAFLEKGSEKLVSKDAVVVALIGFMGSVVATVLSYTVAVLLYSPRNTEFRTKLVDYLGSITWILSVIGFLVGVIGLGVFAVRNLTTQPAQNQAIHFVVAQNGDFS